VAQRKAEGLDRRGGPLAAEDQRDAAGRLIDVSLSRTRTACDRLRAVGLPTELDAFYLDHRWCGELEAGLDGRLSGWPASAARAWRGERTGATITSLDVLVPLQAGAQHRGDSHRVRLVEVAGTNGRLFLAVFIVAGAIGFYVLARQAP
jgi:hypothetical protein